MKTIKSLIGIVSIIMFFAIYIQACITGGKASEVNGTAGVIVAFAIFFGGLVGAVSRKTAIGGFVAAGLFIVGAIIGFANIGAFPYLTSWAIISAVFGVVHVVIGVLMKKLVMDYGVKPKFKPPKNMS
jgi:hypothetical protein